MEQFAVVTFGGALMSSCGRLSAEMMMMSVVNNENKVDIHT